MAGEEEREGRGGWVVLLNHVRLWLHNSSISKRHGSSIMICGQTHAPKEQAMYILT